MASATTSDHPRAHAPLHARESLRVRIASLVGTIFVLGILVIGLAVNPGARSEIDLSLLAWMALGFVASLATISVVEHQPALSMDLPVLLACSFVKGPFAAGLVALGLSITLPAAVAELAALAPFRPPLNLGSLPSLTAQGADIYARWVYGHRFLLPIYGIAISFVLWVAAAGVIHLIARTLGGRGDFAGLAKLVGYAALVGLVALPVALVDALLKLQGATRAESSFGQLAGLVAIGIFLWQNALLVMATRDHYAISTERAVAAVIGPVGAVIVLALALIILGIIFAIMTQQT